MISPNEAAHELLGARESLEVIDGRLRAQDRRSADALNRVLYSALSASVEGGAGGAVSIDRDGRPSLLATVSPLAETDAHLAAFRPAVIVRLTDPSTVPRTREAYWKDLFGLTPAEIRLASSLLAGNGNLRHTADRLGIAYSTARAQLASVFDKANVNSQVQLVRLLTRLGG